MAPKCLFLLHLCILYSSALETGGACHAVRHSLPFLPIAAAASSSIPSLPTSIVFYFPSTPIPPPLSCPLSSSSPPFLCPLLSSTPYPPLHSSLLSPPILCPSLLPLSPPLLYPPLLVPAHGGTFQIPDGNAKCFKLLLVWSLNASLFLTIGSCA